MKTILAIAIMLSSTAGTTTATPLIKVGEPFPVVTLPLCDNPRKSASVMDFRGRKLMLHLFASW